MVEQGVVSEGSVVGQGVVGKGSVVETGCGRKGRGVWWNRVSSQAFPAKRSLYAGGFCACGQLCAWKAWSETSCEVDVWGEWHQNKTPQCSRSSAPARLVYGARDAL